MSDRTVRQIFPELPPDAASLVWKFSDFAGRPNIILVGDPGAGKSHLLREVARISKGLLLTARTFLNDPTIPADSILFIDALDEKRAGRRDQATIDDVVRKLFLLKPKQVCIACREHDWLGGTDLAAFTPYFDQHGGVFVLGLEPLTPLEQKEILSAQGIANSTEFINEAQARGMHEFLVNPQNLIMLSEAVRAGEWPETRSRLLEATTQLLLREHNSNRARSGEGTYTVAEVRDAVGAICALRLISDVAGVSLTESEDDPQLPSYRTIPFAEPKRLLAGLGRRSFTAIGQEAVDYSHRVRAEYLAAGWLAKQVQNGLPLGRVRALLGVEGSPTPELRGLHAWLAVHLPLEADALIDADPYGILIYSDASALSLSQRKRLLDALGKVSSEDPWFRSDARATPGIAAFSSRDMVGHFRSVLRSPTSPFGLKTVVLDALMLGPPIKALQGDLLAILADGAAPYGLKSPALAAVVRMGSSAEKAVARLYSKLNNSADSIRLRADILSRLYPRHFRPSDVARLVTDALTCAEEIVMGIFWPIIEAIPATGIAAVLNALTESPHADSTTRSNDFEALHLTEGLIDRILNERPGHVSGTDLWRWALLRRSFRGAYGYDESERLKSALRTKPRIMRAMFDAAIDSMSMDNNGWRTVQRLNEVMPMPLSGQPLEWLVERIQQKKDSEQKQTTLYELAMSWSYSGAPASRAVFESLYDLANTSSGFAEIREKSTSCPISEWQREDSERRVRDQQERRQGRERNVANFEANVGPIAAGEHAGWLLWIGNVYFANYSDVDKQATPQQRLQNELGIANARIAIEGLKAALQRRDLPTVADIAEASANNSYPQFWYALIAGMIEAWSDNPDLSAFADALLRMQVALNLVLPTRSQRGNVSHEDEYAWKSELVVQQPQMFIDVYLAVARRGLQRGGEHVSGLYALLNDELLSPFLGMVSITLLREFPDTLPSHLENLLRGALATSDARAELLALARNALGISPQLGAEQKRLWTVAAYLLAPDEFEAMFKAEGVAPGIVWCLRALSGGHRNRSNKGVTPIQVPQLELMLTIAANHYPAAGHPTGGWGGSQNPWDASEFIRRLINQLSADRSDQAAEALQRLERSDALRTYVLDIKHAQANQRTLQRQSKYEQPDWMRTIATLSNREPANIADLQALTHSHLADLNVEIGNRNNDIFKQFWNEDSHGRVSRPKAEESCRDVLLGMLRTRLQPLGIIVEPEGHMVADKRADISIAVSERKSLLELKRDTHPEVWTAHKTQLEDFYVRDPDANGHGTYGVFWFGKKRHGKIVAPPYGRSRPQSAKEMEVLLRSMIAPEKRERLEAIVIDVSGPTGADRKLKRRSSKQKKKAPSATRTRTTERRAPRGSRPKRYKTSKQGSRKRR